MFKKILLGAVLLASPILAKAGDRTYGDYLLNDTTLAYSTSPALNLDNIDTLAFQATLASATIAAFSFDDGIPGTGTITVLKPTQMLAAGATFTITVSSNFATTNAIITINGVTYQEGASRQWLKGNTATNTATNLAVALNAASDFDAAASSNVVYGTFTVTGAYTNAYTVTSSTQAALAVAGPSGGLNNLRITVNGRVFDAGSAFTPVSTASGTARVISNAFMADGPTASILTSTWTAAGVVTATATSVGTASNYALTSSSPAIATAAGLTNGSASDISLSGDSITLASHNISTAFPMYWTTVTGTTPTGLTNGTTYYAIKVDANTIKLASSSANARAGTAVDITAVGGRSTFTLTPTAFAGTWTLYWQGSNDNLNWFTLDTSSITYSVPTSLLWAGPIYYRYVRPVFGAGTGGGMNIKVLGNGKKFD